MSGETWTVPAVVTRVVDGDTLVLRLSLGWHIYLDARCRLIGVNAPEMSTPEGIAARSWVMAQLEAAGGAVDGSGVDVILMSHALDKYGRPLGQITITDQHGGAYDLGLALMDAGHAVPMK